jgi:hypothetical protein
MDIEKMWDRLAQHQPFADANSYGPEWARMCAARTKDAAYVAYAAARAAWALEAAATAWAAAKVEEVADEAVRAAIYWIEKADGKNNE